MSSILVLLSGGMDSTTLLYEAKATYDDVQAISFDYGQRHSIELKHAEHIARTARVPQHTVDMGHMRSLMTGSSQTDSRVPVPHGHYEDESMRATVVPNRNMVMLATAAAAAISWKLDEVGYAAHAGDHAVYPDCRPTFIAAMRLALFHCHYDGGVELWTPFEWRTKAHIMQLGWDLAVPFDKTYSCYAGNAIHCGRCGT